jgi:outer membrane lipoprotein SlyB
MHIVGCDNSDDESTDVYTAELVWSTQAKPSSSSSLQSIQKNRQEEVQFTFNVAK